jgi:hypothetical protein
MNPLDQLEAIVTNLLEARKGDKHFNQRDLADWLEEYPDMMMDLIFDAKNMMDHEYPDQQAIYNAEHDVKELKVS